MSRVPGVRAGVVKSLDDPSNIGRVQVSFDWMDDAPQSYWARVAAPMAGGSRGCSFRPELNDEVLVAFDHGDVAHPYVLGYCWSKTDQPPYPQTKEQRGIITPGKHELTFDDDAKKVTLKTQSGFALTLDQNGNTAQLATPGGISLKLDDGASSATIALPSGNQIQIGPSGISVSAAAGTLDVTATSATITASSLTIDAAAVTFTGMITVTGPVITSTGIVSPSYTPGVGNLL